MFLGEREGVGEGVRWGKRRVRDRASTASFVPRLFVGKSLDKRIIRRALDLISNDIQLFRFRSL